MSIKQKTVLIVDDDNDILKFVNKILTTAGMTVITAGSPEEARKLMQLAPPHIILSDINMQPEDGYHFIQSMRGQKQFEKTPVIVMSTINEFNAVKRIVALGISDYAIKPVQPPMLLRKIQKALHNQEFSSWTPELGTEPRLDIIVEADITELGETGYRVSGPFRLAPGKKIKMHSPEFNELGLGKYIQQSSALMKNFVGAGSFSNDITFVAINEEGSSKIRKFVKKSSQNG